MEYNSFRITFDDWDFNHRYVRIGEKGAYIKNCSVNIVWSTISSAYGNSALSDDGKIISNIVLKDIDAQEASIKREIAIIENQLAKIDEIIIRYNAITESIRQFNDDIDHDIREYFDLKIDNVY